MPESVLVLWWITLIAAVVLILPITYYLLERTHRAARHIRDYTGEILEAAEGINRNVAAVAEIERLHEATLRIRRVTTDLTVDAGDLERSLRRG